MDRGTALVCIVGAGPAGLVLGHILHQSNISFVILEREQSGELRSRTKAGLIEQRAVAALRPFGLADTITQRGGRNGICEFRIDGEVIVCDYGAPSDDGQGHYIYPQQELVGDWADSLVAKGGQIRFGVNVVDVAENERRMRRYGRLRQRTLNLSPSGPKLSWPATALEAWLRGQPGSKRSRSPTRSVGLRSLLQLPLQAPAPFSRCTLEGSRASFGARQHRQGTI